MRYRALALNADYSPISLHPLSMWSFDRTLRKYLKGSIQVVEHHDAELRTPTFTYRPPSIIALKKYKPQPHRVSFNKDNVYLRDGYRCQYCNDVYTRKDLTFDHVIPKSIGGPTNFENIVTACKTCNTKKANKRNIKPIRKPYTPSTYQLQEARGKVLLPNDLTDSQYAYLQMLGIT